MGIALQVARVVDGVQGPADQRAGRAENTGKLLPDRADGGVSHGAVRACLGVILFSGFAGYVTPMLVDDWSGGDPDRAGHAYAVNVVGSILGPLIGSAILSMALPPGSLFYFAAIPRPATKAFTARRSSTSRHCWHRCRLASARHWRR